MDDWNHTQQSTCYIVRSQSESTSRMTTGMHPKQSTIMHNVIANTFDLVTGSIFNGRFVSSFVFRVLRHHSADTECMRTDVVSVRVLPCDIHIRLSSMIRV